MKSVRQAADYPQMIAAATSERVRIQLAASWIHSVFDQFYKDFLKLTWSAKAAFENRDHPASVACAKKRLGLYNATVYALAWDLRAAFPALAQRASLWAQVEAAFLPAVEGRTQCFPVQHHAAPASRPALLDHRVSSREQGSGDE